MAMDVEVKIDGKARAWFKEKVGNYLASILSNGTPPVHLSVDSARAVGRGRKQVIVADVTMFDGLPATLEIFQHGPGMLGHRWARMDGGTAFFEGGRWQREASLEPTP